MWRQNTAEGIAKGPEVGILTLTWLSVQPTSPQLNGLFHSLCSVNARPVPCTLVSGLAAMQGAHLG